VSWIHSLPLFLFLPDNKALTLGQIALGPVYIFPSLLVFVFWRTIQKKLGKYWLWHRRRRQQDSVEMSRTGLHSNIAADRGDLGEVNQAICTGADLNEYHDGA
jgi:hypothetical protein